MVGATKQVKVRKNVIEGIIICVLLKRPFKSLNNIERSVNVQAVRKSC